MLSLPNAISTARSCSTAAFVILQWVIDSSEGTRYIKSISTFSTIARSPLAPVFRCKVFSAIASIASSSTVASVPPQGGRKHPQQELLQIDTTNILFICGGAFEGLDKIVENRMDQKSMGFNAEIADKREKDQGMILKQALPQDFVKFGLIPEFVGRVPVTVSLYLSVTIPAEDAFSRPEEERWPLSLPGFSEEPAERLRRIHPW